MECLLTGCDLNAKWPLQYACLEAFSSVAGTVWETVGPSGSGTSTGEADVAGPDLGHPVCSLLSEQPPQAPAPMPSLSPQIVP